MLQPVNNDDLYNYELVKAFSMIDNYIYLYHTDTLIALPLYPEQIADTEAVSYNPTTFMSRSAPVFSYSGSGPRLLNFTLPLHRDMMNAINTANSGLNVPNLDDDDYVDTMVKQLQSIAFPRYAASSKLVDPPLVAVRFGNDIFCKGVVDGSVTVIHSGPILQNDKYALVTVEFSIKEVDPYDADSVASQGGYRGIRTSLESIVWK